MKYYINVLAIDDIMNDKSKELENLKNKYYNEIQKNLENNKKLEEMILRVEKQLKLIQIDKESSQSS